MIENTQLNKVQNRVVVIQGDAKKVIQQTLKNTAHRVLMPLPEKAFEYLSYALLTLKAGGGWIHYYAFEHAKKPESPLEKVKEKVLKKLQELNVNFKISSSRIVRAVGPNWYQINLDVLIK